MYQNLALSIAPDGLTEAPPPPSGPLGPYSGGWDVSALSLVRGWSHEPMSYGPSGVFRNAFAVVISLTPTRRRTTVNGDVVFEGWTAPGAMRVQRPCERVATDMFTPFDQVALYIPTVMLREIQKEQSGSEDIDIDIIDPLWQFDKFIDASMRCMVSAIDCRRKDSLSYINSLGRNVASHILYHYARGSADAQQSRDPHSRDQHSRGSGARSIQQAVRFIEANIENSPSLAEMASAASLPVDKFRREFKAATDMSPHQYLIRRRVDRACELIAASAKPKFAEIALECGFADQSHLSTTFRRVLGVSPARFVHRPT
jgi:AraC family transcriptional regulator